MNIQLSTCNLQPATLEVLVIGYGNTLRSDDGVGQAVAEAVKAWELPHVHSLAVHQLTPELAEPLSSVDLAIFVDAYPVGCEQEVQVSPLKPTSSGWTMGHTSVPRAILAIAQALYHYHPQAWLVAIPGKDFELGVSTAEPDSVYRLSPLAKRGMEEALEIIDSLIREQISLLAPAVRN